MAYKTKNIDTINPAAGASFNKITVNRFIRTEASDASGTPAQNLQGSAYGYASGGYSNTPPYIANDIDRFPFASDTNASLIGTMTVYRLSAGSAMSPTEGFNFGGHPPYSTPSLINVIDKFPFAAAPATSTDHGDLTVRRARTGGNSSETHGYATGGFSPWPGTNTVQKFPFSTIGNSTDVLDLSAIRLEVSSQSSTTHGYSSGGNGPYPNRNVIDKFPFASDDNATDVGNLNYYYNYHGGGSQSTTHGYVAGGSFYTNVIEKFPFAVDGNSSDIANLVYSISLSGGASSTTHGYAMGSWPNNKNYIQKYSFSVDQNATDVGDLSRNKGDVSGHHV